MKVARFLPCLALFAGAAVLDAQSPGALKGWAESVASVEARVARELDSGQPFLALDVGKSGAGDRRAVLGGQIVTRKLEPLSLDTHGKSIDVPDGIVHDWLGAVLVPGVKLDDLLFQLQHVPPQTYQEDVLTSIFTPLGPDAMKTYLKLQRKKMLVTAVYNTEHQVEYTHYGPARASSISRATKIVELAEPGTPKQREKAPGQDRGYLWRWNSYWRYEQVDTGVIVECESLSLSRSVPLLLRPIAGPIVSSTARESMERTLKAIRDRLPKRQ